MGRNVMTLAALSLCLTAGLLGGCGSSNREGDGSSSSLNAARTANRNLSASILSVTVSSPPVVTFSLTDENGNPLDPTTTGLTARFTIAQIGADGNYRNYILTSGTSANPNQPTFDSGGQFARVGKGVYTYTFKTDITQNPMFDRSLTHTIGGQFTREVPKVFGSGTFQQAANPYLNFRPDGGTVTVSREIVSTSACNECHGLLRAHGGGRRDVALCILCHYPGPIDSQSANPIDMRYLIHKIHMGEKLPSNEAGGDFNYVGFQNATTSFKTVAYPFMSGDAAIASTPVDCAKCHKRGSDLAGRSFGRDVDRWKEAPTRYNCKTCHDNITFGNTSTTTTVGRFTLPAGTADPQGRLHTGGPVPDGSCAGCHSGDAEFGGNAVAGSAIGAHTIIEQSSVNSGINFRILSVQNAVAGQAPQVTVRITDNAGNPIALPTPPASNPSFNLKLGLMRQADFLNVRLEPNGQPLTRALTTQTTTTNGDGSYTTTFATPIPAGTTGVGVIGLEGRRQYSFTGKRASDSPVNIGGTSVQYFFDVATGQQITDPARQRRAVVDVNKCNRCHTRLTLHGANRVNSITECDICHNPNGNDAGRRTGVTPQTAADRRTAQSIDLKVMIHKIHTGEELELSKPYVVYGFGTPPTGNPGSPVDFSEVRYPNDRRDCLACHINTNTYALPLPQGVFGNVTSTFTNNSSASRIRYAPMTAVCTSCHDDTGTTGVHVPVNRRNVDQNANGVVCTACHRSGLILGPDNAHQLPYTQPPASR